MKPLSLSKPHLIVMVGIPGAGKSFFAEHFASTFNAPYVSYDRIRSELFNDPTHSDDENAIIGRVSDYLLDELLKTGQTVIFEGSALARTERQDIAARARSGGYEPLFVWVQTESATARQRVLKSSKGKATLSDKQFESLLGRFTAPNAAEKAIVISGKHTYASQLKIVLQRLIGPQQAPHTPPKTTINVTTHPRIIGGNRLTIR